MWIKFDGEGAFVKADEWQQFKKFKEFTIDKWVHIVETDGKLFIDGKEQ